MDLLAALVLFIPLAFIFLLLVGVAKLLEYINEQNNIAEREKHKALMEAFEREAEARAEAFRNAATAEDARRALMAKALEAKKKYFRKFYTDSGFEPPSMDDITIDSDSDIDYYAGMEERQKREEAEKRAEQKRRLQEEAEERRLKEIEEAKAAGKDVCDDCGAIEPRRCRGNGCYCSVCLEHNQEFYPGLCYSCSSDMDDD